MVIVVLVRYLGVNTGIYMLLIFSSRVLDSASPCTVRQVILYRFDKVVNERNPYGG